MNDLNEIFYQPFVDFLLQPSREKLSTILTQNLGEFDHLDFKAEISINSKLAKHILAFANSRGGAIVFGVIENNDHSLTTQGLSNAKDKAELARGVRKFIPDSVKFHLLDFTFTEKEPQSLTGKTIQVLLVLDNVQYLPFVSKSDGDAINEGNVYVRDGTESRPATHTQLQEIINRRIATSHSTSRELTLKQHLEELQTLYSLIPRQIGGGFTFPMLESLSLALQNSIDSGKPNPDYPKESFEDFLNRAIEIKKKVVIDFLKNKY